MSSSRFDILHVLAIKTMASTDAITPAVGPEAKDVLDELRRLRDQGWAEHLERRDIWRITKQGRIRHAELMSDEIPSEIRELLRAGYDHFLSLDQWFKGVCTRWQVRAGVPNDHSDAEYSASIVTELGEIHAGAQALVADFGRVLPRLANYQGRLSDAVNRLHAGDTQAFTGVLCDSYHDIWMELHRELQLLLQIDRKAEELRTGAAR